MKAHQAGEKGKGAMFRSDQVNRTDRASNAVCMKLPGGM